ncbi:hypothetical protein Agub_g3036 [Astrephomene gubernaculifera]|uniref:Histidine kinase/HSP90-like ATPase domain-containing protein n=1 Tax=Astrephomene gubernaculifera TaxID=47775 RepID=A0AAD3DIA7_9CHLO|nr:hypothetical protein Agub_g3036 [Astrephomene gubernaculifera]
MLGYRLGSGTPAGIRRPRRHGPQLCPSLHPQPCASQRPQVHTPHSLAVAGSSVTAENVSNYAVSIAPSSSATPSQAAYDASSIQVLEGLEPVRKRPGMYIGGTGSEGLHHLVWEVVDNCIDEVQAGHAGSVEVELDLGTGWVTVRDDGRGIPVDPHPATGKSTLETVLTVLHAGGKFGGENSGYKFAP